MKLEQFKIYDNRTVNTFGPPEEFVTEEGLEGLLAILTQQ